LGGTLAGMRIKLFHGARIAEAMAKVRAELGSEALILATRAVGGGVEITAAIAGGDEAAPVAMRAAEPVAAEDSLIWHGIPAALAQRLCGLARWGSIHLCCWWGRRVGGRVFRWRGWRQG